MAMSTIHVKEERKWSGWIEELRSGGTRMLEGRKDQSKRESWTKPVGSSSQSTLDLLLFHLVKPLCQLEGKKSSKCLN
jgi:hypothetical protein